MQIAFFDTKPYDIPAFEKYGKTGGVEFKYYERVTVGRGAASSGSSITSNS